VQWTGGGLPNDVAGWVASPNSNFGWLMVSSTESSTDMVQAFSRSSQLMLSYSCKPGFLETLNGCTTCTVAAQNACAVSAAGNTCNDSGPPSTTYSCTCNNPAFSLGPGGTSCTDVIFANGFEGP
jgi:hypothetical protein